MRRTPKTTFQKLLEERLMTPTERAAFRKAEIEQQAKNKKNSKKLKKRAYLIERSAQAAPSGPTGSNPLKTNQK